MSSDATTERVLNRDIVVTVNTTVLTALMKSTAVCNLQMPYMWLLKIYHVYRTLGLARIN